MKTEDTTIQYYNHHASEFIDGTENADMSELYALFLEHIKKPPAHILDLGCGSARDTRYFLEKGYDVTAVDASKSICDEVCRRTGITVQNRSFSDINEVEQYDAVWACASLLHVTFFDLKEDVFPRVIQATKPDGIIYVSFKYGKAEGLEGERHFTRLDKQRLQELIADISCVRIMEEYISKDVRPDRHNEQWLNAILQKQKGK